MSELLLRRRAAMAKPLNYLHIKSLGNGDLTISIPARVASNKLTYIAWSRDGKNWNTTNIDDTEQAITIAVETGDVVYIKGRGHATAVGYSSSGYHTHITSTSNYEVAGNIMSLIFADDFEGKELNYSNNYTFTALFKESATLVNASNLELPASGSGIYTYAHMFYGCSSLLLGPQIGTTTQRDHCFDSMFYGCLALIAGPRLLAGTIIAYTACYRMFYNCRSLTLAPVINVSTLYERSCREMFYNCRSLSYIKMLATDISNAQCLYNWVYGVAKTGTFVKNSEATWDVSGASGVPAGWTVEFDGTN